MAPNTVSLRVWDIKEDKAPLAAGKDVTPGMLLELSGANVQPHSNASALPKPILIAVEAPYREGAGIDTDYDQDGEEVDFHYAQSGEQFYMLLAAGQEVDALTDRLGSDAAGALQIATTYAFCRPLELKDNSAGYTPVRIRVEVL
jgi:hypothetical protein